MVAKNRLPPAAMDGRDLDAHQAGAKELLQQLEAKGTLPIHFGNVRPNLLFREPSDLLLE